MYEQPREVFVRLSSRRLPAGWIIYAATLAMVPACLSAVAADHPANVPVLLASGIAPEEVERRPYASYVRQCADLLLEHGTDRYGKLRRPLLVAILDVRSRACPSPDVLKPEQPGREPLAEPRLCWKVQGADFYMDQITLDVLYLLSDTSGDTRYAAFADAYLREAMSLVDEKGLFWWGSHRCYDVFADEMRSSPIKGIKNWHEIHVIRPRWERLWQVDPRATRRELEAIWQWHVIDKKTGEIDRHSSGTRGCDFAMSGGMFVHALAFLGRQTKDPIWYDRATLVADYYWRSRNPKTNLIPNCPNDKNQRFDGTHFDTSITGNHCYCLLKAYELAGREIWRDHAMAYLRAYARYGFDKNTGRFWGALRLDGTPETGSRKKNKEFYSHADYSQNDPLGYVDLWQPHALGYEFGLATAQVYALAAQLTGDRQMLETARKWAQWIRKSPPAEGPISSLRWEQYGRLFAPHGTYAEYYGRTVSFFLHVYSLTGEQMYLEDARRLAKEAVSKLWYQGLFRGHPAVPYYFSTGGVGHLLYALVQLDRVLASPDAAVKARTVPRGACNHVMAWDNW
jgi:hypothetical protein